MIAFEFQAQQYDGSPFNGTITAPTADEVHARLRGMGLQVISVKPAARTVRSAKLGPADLEMFNEQLLQLAIAGLPLERGLELLAKDVRSSRLRSAMQALAADLSSGKPIQEALDSHRNQFPPIYARLIDAGIQTSNLPGVLHSFGRHMRTVSRLRSEIWRACAYPMMLLVAFSLLLIFLSYWVLPQYYGLIKSISLKTFSMRTFKSDTVRPGVPAAAEVIYYIGRAMPYILGALIAAWAVVFGGWVVLRTFGRERWWTDAVLLRVPLIGTALRHNYVARWTDALAIAVRAGLDLPRAIQLAGQVVALPSIEQDGVDLIAMLQAGRTLDQPIALRRIPASVPPAIELATRNGNLADVLEGLALQFERQADQRVRLIPAILMPILVVLVGVFAGGILYGLWIPMQRLLQGMTG